MARRLETYDAKRDFRVTPEPPPNAPRPRRAGPLTFMVHKHHARRLHYDLRLESEGVLASWAVPKGPSYDPAEKRLAVETEDHPLAYGAFEGRIPDGEYGAGDSLIWDRGTYDTDPPGEFERQKAKGHLALVLRGEKLRGKWHLVRTRPSGGKEQWIFFKAKDPEARPDYDVVAERPESVASGRRVTRGPVSAKSLRARHPAPMDLLLRVWPPMLATLARPEEAAGDGWHLEVKYDGFRALAGLSGGRLSLQSRNGLDLSGRFPAIAAALPRLWVGEAVLDGEIVALDRRGVSRFQQLQSAAGELRYAVFDLLWHEGEDLRARPIEERQELLASLLAGVEPPLELAEGVEGAIEKALERARRAGWEGVVAKRRGSPYRGGRGRDWLKVKVANAQEFAIVGFTPISTGASAVGALLVGVADRGGFRYAGKVGTGYTDAIRRELWDLLSRDVVDASAAAGANRASCRSWYATMRSSPWSG